MHGVFDYFISDYLPVFAVVNKPKSTNTSNTFIGRCYRNYNKFVFYDHLMGIDWNRFTEEEDLNVQWDLIINGITNYLDNVCPKKLIRIRGPCNDWITHDIKELIVEMRQLFKMYSTTKDPIYFRREDSLLIKLLIGQRMIMG